MSTLVAHDSRGQACSPRRAASPRRALLCLGLLLFACVVLLGGLAASHLTVVRGAPVPAGIADAPSPSVQCPGTPMRC
ncbi:MAG: hypothetical protein IVW57_07410 [Ktedonobacterales bacterium]|nr:hypothetical protein [Ktedonobacterales bacterium]